MSHCSDVAIVGGGLAGAAIAQQCVSRGLDAVLLEESTAGGSGATRYSRGIVRGFDPDPYLMQWSLRGAQAWREWNAPGPSPYHACGVLYLLAAPEAGAAVRCIREADSAAYPMELLRGGDIARRFPWLELPPERVAELTVVFEPRGGYCDPRLAARLYCEAVRSAGGTVIEGAQVEAIEERAQCVLLRTAAGAVLAKVAVVAAGASSVRLCPEPSVFVRSIPLSCFEATSVPERFPSCVIDGQYGGYARPEPPRHVFFGGGRQQDAVSPAAIGEFSPAHHAEHLEKLRKLLRDARPTPVAGVMGYDAYTPSLRPVLGFGHARSRLCRAFGFSGRGAKYIPAVAPVLAEQIDRRVRAQ
jgi:glycine/D-amino acid oxidase-like deaminating enzyme